MIGGQVTHLIESIAPIPPLFLNLRPFSQTFLDADAFLY